MFKRILVAVDGSPTANRGLKSAIDMASDQQATMLVLHVVNDAAAVPATEGFIPADLIESMVESMRESGSSILARATQLARHRGLDAEALLVETAGRTVPETILVTARKHKADLIVLGTHGRRGLRRVLLGSDAEEVLREAKVPVMLVRSPEPAKRKPHSAAQRRSPPKRATQDPSGKRVLQ